MNRILLLLLAILLVLGALTAPPARAVEDQVYTCDGLTFPDGTAGVAVVTVVLSGDAPTVMVTAEYYTAGYVRYLGRYDDWSSAAGFPINHSEAEEFALRHYEDRQ